MNTKKGHTCDSHHARKHWVPFSMWILSWTELKGLDWDWSAVGGRGSGGIAGITGGVPKKMKKK